MALALIAVLALVIDRRVFLTAAIAYIAIVIGWIVRGEDGDFASWIFVLILLGAVITALGTWWVPLRAALMRALPDFPGKDPPAPLCGDRMTNLTPREIVSELDRFIIGQNDAKRAVAVALRNRWRRKQLGDDLRDEVYPKNILMIGPTGVGKTEISRRLAKLAKAPFLKVEATKFTEVGYVGRDVDSIIRDLVDAAIVETRAQMREEVRAKAQRAAEERVIEALAGKDAREQTREMFRGKLKRGELDATMIEMDVAEPSPAMPMLGGHAGHGTADAGAAGHVRKAFGGRKVRRRLTVAESYDLLIGEEADKLLDDEAVTKAGAGGRAGKRDRLYRRDRQGLRPGRHARGRCQPRRRAARPAAADRGHDRFHQVRAGEDRPHPVHRQRGVPHRQAVGPAARTAGPPADPGGAAAADRGRFRPHPDRDRTMP